eukprot:symbB.v1.2.008571.t1/scaffold511.1/size325556/18
MVDFGGQTAYEVLGVPENSTFDVVRKRFLDEARKWHPDKQPRGREEDMEKARGRFILIHAAYQELLGSAPTQAPQEAKRDSVLFDVLRKEAENLYQQAAKDYEQEKQYREEFEDYMNELRRLGCGQESEESEEFKDIMKAWHRTHCAFLVHQARESQAKMKMRNIQTQIGVFERSFKDSRDGNEAPVQDQEGETPSIADLSSSFVTYVGDSVKQIGTDATYFVEEIAKDVNETLSSLAGYFNVWRLTRDDPPASALNN